MQQHGVAVSQPERTKPAFSPGRYGAAPTTPPQTGDAAQAAGQGGTARNGAQGAQDGMTAERRKNFTVRPGFAYYLVSIPQIPGQQFGLCTKDYQNAVLVCQLEEGSSASETLRVMDHIIDVNGVPVTDREVCKQLINDSLMTKAEVNMIIERPVEQQAVNLVENALNASQMQEPSVALASDVKSILRRYNDKLKQGHGQMLPVLL
ncbi:hypothetical protein Y032_0031g2275 [Ancylostoma ceylanicum]|uniref:PDZ domain-containing protein n=1 Tax=Ancylostoma ceylanicum TaxID=53326 RepID=A0A016URI8_9BILA|nr:hypothetical protein Y032_0031g2275 [Ancylostoma ceylanicum]